ncbi:MAG TPA: MFS transporter [Mycobacteriales bacterium]|jgi:DHA2 family multidrug resistance protein-like MFS transporter|nr:MFS transporter [Mycobacteriales bacterium]
MDQPRSVPAAPAGHPRRWTILAVMVVSLLVVVLDNTILNVALKTIADPRAGLGASQSDLEWSINSYTLVFAGLLFTAGLLGDRLGRRRMLVTGLGIFGIASLASAYAQSPGQLIGARALMGLGAAAIMPATLAIISTVFEPRERGRAIGVWAGAVGLAVAIGPVVGGALLEHFWWGSVFLVNVPIVIAGIAAVAVLVPESRNPAPGRIDLVGVLLSVVGLATFVYGIITGGDSGDWFSPGVLGTIAAGALILGAFVLYERRVAYPALDVRLFQDPRFASAVGSVGLVFFAAMGSLFFGTFYLQIVRGYSPLETGLLFLPFAAAQLIFAPRSAGLVATYGPKRVTAAGMGLVTVGLAAFLLIGTGTPIWVLAAVYFVMGAGMANVVAPTTEAVMSSLPRERAGVGSAVSNTVRQVGGALGVAVLGSVLSQVYRGGIEGHLSVLPAGVRDAAGESLAATYAAAANAGPAGAGLLGPADGAFVHAMHWAAGGSAVAALLGMIAVLRWLPGHVARHPEPVSVDELDARLVETT